MLTRRALLASVPAAGLLAFASEPHAASPPAPITVLAASSLTESLQKVAAAWTAKGHPAVTLSFDASSRLAKQIEAGAPVDAFFSADNDWMDYLDTRGLIDRPTRVDLLGNTLVAVVPVGSGLVLDDAAGLGQSGVQHLALAGESVPAGKYARAALSSLGGWDALEDRVVRGDNVRTVLGWVASGEAEAGVVYATDARVEPRVQVAFTFPRASYPPIVYAATVVAGAVHAKEAAAFLVYCRSAEGMAVFAAAGFTPPPAVQ